VLVVHRRGGFGGRDRAMIASLAAQLSMGLENARLYEQLDGLFRQYMSPDVATALIADPRQAALGGRGRRGHRRVRRPARVHHVLRGVDARADRRDAQPLLRGGHR
jgi:GAF domain-containing protein